MNQLMNEVKAGREVVQQLTTKVAQMSVSSAQPHSPTPERRQTRVSFEVPNSDARMQRAGGPPPPYFRDGCGSRGQSRGYNFSANRQSY